MNRLCILDDERLQLKPVSLRLWFAFLLAFVLGTALAVSAGAWWIVRQDYIHMNGIINEAVTRNDRLMAICVMSEKQAKEKVKRNVPLNIGGEER